MTNIQIDCFLESVKTKSFSGAAKALFLSAQVVSQHIGNLETEIGVPLFDRNKDGVALTEMGWHFFDFATKWQGLYEQTLVDIKELYNSMSLLLKIGISEYIDVAGELSSGLLDFKEKHPSITIGGGSFSNREILQKVTDGEIDIAIMCDTQVVTGGDFEMVPFAKEDLRLYISGLSEDIQQHIKDKNDISKYTQNLPHIDASYGIWNAKDWDEMSRRMSTFLGFVVKERHVMPNFRSVIACLKNMPCTAVSDARFGYVRESDGIFSIPLDIDTNICCVWHKRNENPSIKVFVEFMKWYYDEFNK